MSCSHPVKDVSCRSNIGEYIVHCRKCGCTRHVPNPRFDMFGCLLPLKLWLYQAINRFESQHRSAQQ
jgi:hypothetical protein